MSQILTAEEKSVMIYRGIAQGKVIELEDDAVLPEGTRVSVIPETSGTTSITKRSLTLKAWLEEARLVRAQLPMTSDSVEILRALREQHVRP
jgi:hypothetical protein